MWVIRLLRGWVSATLGPPVFEEIRVVHALLRRRRGTLVDVGAHHGGSLLPFAKEGWEVHAFEPAPFNRGILVANLAQVPDHRVRVDPRAVSDQDGHEVTLYRSEVSSGIASVRPFHASHVPGPKVKTVSLEAYLRGAGVRQVDFLKVDAEGADLSVLEGFPWNDLRPPVVMCEFEDRKTREFGYAFDDLASFLVDRGYHVLVSEWYPVIEYGMRHRWRRCRKYPCRLADAEAWGNLIALSDRSVLDAFERRLRFERWRYQLRRAVDRIRGRL